MIQRGISATKRLTANRSLALKPKANIANNVSDEERADSESNADRRWPATIQWEESGLRLRSWRKTIEGYSGEDIRVDDMEI